MAIQELSPALALALAHNLLMPRIKSKIMIMIKNPTTVLNSMAVGRRAGERRFGFRGVTGSFKNPEGIR